MTKIVVAGCGIAGFDVVRRLAKETDADITAVNKTNHLTFYPSIHEVAIGKRDFSDVSINLATYFNQARYRNVEFVRGTVDAVNAEEEYVETGDGEQFSYDILVVALGSDVNFFGVTPEEDVHTILYRDEIEETQAAIPRLCRHRDEADIVVVGGGATGVEAAAILASTLQGCPANTRITLLEAGPEILSQINEAGRRKARDRLKALDVNIRTEAQVTDITADKTVELEDGGVVDADEVIWAAGVKVSEAVETLPFPSTEHGEITVNKFLQVKDEENVYAAGDCIALPDQHKIKRAYYAVKEARHVAENITRQLRDEELVKYQQEPDPPFILQMGGRKALYTHGDTAWLGYIPWLMEKIGVEKRYFWPRTLF